MIIAVTGGIGAGKSVVCKILRVMGFPVYDCDTRARDIMDSDITIRRALALEISGEVIDGSGAIDRPKLSAIVFSDPDKLQILNRIVHAAVRDDLRRWIKHVETTKNPENTRKFSKDLDADATAPVLSFVETAILYQSGLDRMVDAVWEVEAPENVRVERVCLRNSLTPDQVTARIRSQYFDPECPHPQTMRIINDGTHSLLLQIHSLLS